MFDASTIFSLVPRLANIRAEAKWFHVHTHAEENETYFSMCNVR